MPESRITKKAKLIKTAVMPQEILNELGGIVSNIQTGFTEKLRDVRGETNLEKDKRYRAAFDPAYESAKRLLEIYKQYPLSKEINRAREAVARLPGYNLEEAAAGKVFAMSSGNSGELSNPANYAVNYDFRSDLPPDPLLSGFSTGPRTEAQ